jgi:DUF971 family protein
MGLRPKHIDLRKDESLTIEWEDGSRSVLPIPYLRRMSPSADARTLRESLARNPLTVLPSGASSGPITADSAELVGNYALRIRFSDGHDTGLYTWSYLREIADAARGGNASTHSSPPARPPGADGDPPERG